MTSLSTYVNQNYEVNGLAWYIKISTVVDQLHEIQRM